MHALAQATAAAAAATAALLFWLRRRQPPQSFPGPHTPLLRESLPSCPFELLHTWIAEAQAALGFLESHAMIVATADADGGPTARTVVLQLADSSIGLVFGSSRSSLKGRQATADGRAELVLRHGQRQVRVRGRLRLDEALAARSFQLVAPPARLGLQQLQQGHEIGEQAWEALRTQVDEAVAQSSDGDSGLLTPPADYVAFVLSPDSFEFYNGGHPAYMNDRFLFVRRETAASTLLQLACSNDDGHIRFAPPVRLQA